VKIRRAPIDINPLFTMPTGRPSTAAPAAAATDLMLPPTPVAGNPALDGAPSMPTVTPGGVPPLPAAGQHEVFDALSLKPVTADVLGVSGSAGASAPAGTVERYLADVKRQLMEKGLPTRAPHVRIALVGETESDGRLDEHGQDVARAIAGPVALAQDADVRIVDATELERSLVLQQRDPALSLEMIESGDCTFADLGRCIAGDLCASVDRERELLTAVAATLPPATDGRTRLIVNVSNGAIPIKRALFCVQDLFTPKGDLRVPMGSRLEHELLDLLRDQPPAQLTHLLTRRIAGAVHEALRQSPAREALAAARGRLEQTVHEIRKAGVLPFISAGNLYDQATELADDTDSLNLKAVKGDVIVGATALGDALNRGQDRSTSWSSGSAQDPHYVTLSTVGADVPVGPDKSLVDGTSFSTPIAASVAALMIEANPSLTPDDVERLMTDPRAVRDLPGTRDGAGELDPVAAVELAAAARRS
jgi:hypothetical protein